MTHRSAKSTARSSKGSEPWTRSATSCGNSGGHSFPGNHWICFLKTIGILILFILFMEFLGEGKWSKAPSKHRGMQLGNETTQCWQPFNESVLVCCRSLMIDAGEHNRPNTEYHHEPRLEKFHNWIRRKCLEKCQALNIRSKENSNTTMQGLPLILT